MPRLFLPLLAIVLTLRTSAEEISPQEAEAIYMAALVKERTCPFLSYETQRESKRGPARTKHYFKRSDQGIMFFRSDEVCIHKNTGHNLATSIFNNMEGRWTVVDKTAVRMPALIDPDVKAELDMNELHESEDPQDQEIDKALLAMRESQSPQHNRYSGQRNIVGERTLITIKIELSSEEKRLQNAILIKKIGESRRVLESLQLRAVEVDRQIDKLLKLVPKLSPARLSIVIDPQIPLIIERRLLNEQGAPVQEKIRLNVQTDRAHAPPDSFFELPSGAKRYFPTDITDYQSELKRAWRRQLDIQRKTKQKNEKS